MPLPKSTLSPLDIPPGAHQLTIQFKAKSNSGSLADEVGAEYFQVWKTWVLKVVKYDIDPPEVPDLKITETDGWLRLDWTAYTKKNFVSYTLKLSFPQEHEIVFTDPLTTHWVDSSFLWGPATFALTVSNTHGTASNNTRIALYAGKVKLKGNKNAILLGSNSDPIAASWDGLRLGLSGVYIIGRRLGEEQ